MQEAQDIPTSGEFVRPAATRSTGISFAPEENPFSTVFADVTHRCNMACHNCYIPNRDIPDMDADWLAGILARLPKRTRIRLVGAEPTVRTDLPDLIRMVRRLGHIPVILSNGLRLGNRWYVQRLKAAGLRTVHLSLNGGLDDDAYEAIDGLRCAARKLKALSNLLDEHYLVTAGMIVVPGVNDRQLGGFYRHLRTMGARELHLRSVGAFGRHLEDCAMSLSDLIAVAEREIGISHAEMAETDDDPQSARHFVHDGMRIQITQWPDLGSRTRGRLTPEGRLEPMFEHLMLNAAEGGY